MDGNKFRAALLAVAAAVVIPVINSIYGKLPAAVTAAVTVTALIVLIVLIIKKPQTKGRDIEPEICSDIKNISLTARGKNYFISTGTAFNIDDNLQTGLMSYVEKGVWHIEDNGETGNAPIEIRLPEDFIPERLDISIETGNVIVLIPSASSLRLNVHDGNAEIRRIRIGDLFTEAGKGKINLTAVLSGSAQINCGSGSVNALFENTSEEFNIEAMTGMGSIRIGDEVFDKERRKGSIGGSAEKNIKLSCGMGSIEIDFGRRESV